MDPGGQGVEGRRLRASLGKKLFGGAAEQAEVTIDRYVLLAPLGRGGMATVYRARDPELARIVAIKLVEDLTLAPSVRRARRRRTVREAQVLARLSHPNIVEILDVGQTERGVFLAMELVSGGSLEEWLAAQRVTDPRHVTRVAAMLDQAFEGVAAAHAANVIHRDIKPSNLLLGADGRVRVADFGLARPSGESTSDAAHDPVHDPVKTGHSSSLPLPESEERLTQTGAVLGTPAYMPPEQLQGRTADQRSDVFSLCATAYELFTGVRPFQARSSAALLLCIEDGNVSPPPSGVRLPGALERVLRRGLDPRPEHRHPDVRTLQAELRSATSRKWKVPSLIAAGVAVAVASGAYVASRSPSSPLSSCLDNRDRMAELFEGDRLGALRSRYTEQLQEPGVAVFERTRAALQGRARDWEAVVEDTCRAAWARDEPLADDLDPILECLDREHRATEQFLEMLLTGSRTALLAAPRVVLSWSRLSGCLDETSEVPAQLRDQETIERWRQRVADLTHARSLKQLGDKDAAARQVELVLDDSVSMGVPQLRARALVLKSEIELMTGSPQRSLELADEAITTAISARDDETAGRAMLQTSRVYSEEMQDFEAAFEWLERAKAAFERAGSSPRLFRQRQFDFGAALVYSGAIEDARERFEALLTEIDAADDAGPFERINVMDGLSRIYGILGDYDRAETLARTVIERETELTGGRGADAATSWCSLSELLFRKAKYTEALRSAQTCYEIHVASSGPDSLASSDGLQMLSIAADGLDDHEASVDYARRARSISERIVGREHPRYLVQAMDVVNGLIGAERYDEAWVEVERLVEPATKLWGETSPGLAVVVAIRAKVLHRLQRLDESEADYRRAIAIRQEVFGPRHVEVGKSKLMLARVVLARERPAEAIELLTEALAIGRDELPGNHPRIINTLEALADAQLALGASDRARTHLEEAVALQSTAEGPDAEPGRLDGLRAKLSQLAR